MIRRFRHKALKRFFEEDDRRGLPFDMVARIGDILQTLDASDAIEGMDRPSYRLHALRGDLKGCWAVTVRANWRIVFRLDCGDAVDVDFIDYH